LGRYANAVVCVSETIRDRVAELNPAIGERAVVIHNTSVRTAELDAPRGARAARMRLVYSGRLVQYQKRILDFVSLADALAARGVDFQIDLIGEFAVDDIGLTQFEAVAARHLAAGTIRLRGRLTRGAVLAELRGA